MPTSYFLTYDGTLGRGNWAPYSYVDALGASTNQNFINLKYYTDASLLTRDASISAAFALVGTGYSGLKLYTDASFITRDICINALYGTIGNGYNNLNSSVNTALHKYLKESSLGAGFIWDGSKLTITNQGTMTLWDLADVSIQLVSYTSRNGRLLTYDEDNGQVWRDTPPSFPTYTEVSTGLVKNLANYIKSSSTGSSIKWHAGLIDISLNITFAQLTDVSIVNPTYNNILEYDGDIHKWKNAYPVEIDDYFIAKNSSINTSTSALLRFDKTMGYIHGTVSSPITGAITAELSNALVGVVDMVIHRNGTNSVSLPSTFKLMSGNYDRSINNYIYVQYLEPSTQLYSINHGL